MGMPSAALVDAYLAEIAKGYNIKWSPPKADDDDGSDGGVKVSRPSSHLGPADARAHHDLPYQEVDQDADLEVPIAVKSDIPGTSKLPDLPPVEGDEGAKQPAKASEPPEDDFTALAKRFEALKKR